MVERPLLPPPLGVAPVDLVGVGARRDGDGACDDDSEARVLLLLLPFWVVVVVTGEAARLLLLWLRTRS